MAGACTGTLGIATGGVPPDGDNASPEVLAETKNVRLKLSAIKDINQINTDPAVQKALKAVFAPLGTAIDDMRTSIHKKAGRSIEV